MSQYHSKEFKALQASWYRKLARDGHQDIENKYGDLYQHDIRTVSWENQERIRDFYLKLDAYVTNTDTLSPVCRRILELWSTGMFLVMIAKTVGKSLSYVKTVTQKHKNIVMSSDF